MLLFEYIAIHINFGTMKQFSSYFAKYLRTSEHGFNIANFVFNFK